ncbi:carbohydrate esterase family 16 protein [Macrolepiota fuliginosa MF-IS2]|uniref:Carbohydrate esterase family 16 protein n=1 Tax=Macrolepiota fuliginosa MF-IS2 TaxID=1400762 RepID=A0A9P5X6H9_9AGAR|nr:carbohydrate esterase family 16 protein [Macrolepiota fuliginosa MF-IS2]
MFIDVFSSLIVVPRFLSSIAPSSHHHHHHHHPTGNGIITNSGDPDQKPFPLPPDNNGIHLAIGPQCGTLFGNTADINAGIDGGTFETIVSFGDSYTDGGKDDGSPLDPPVLVPPSPLAGGRSTNGLTWVELVAADANATIMDYAQSGACIDLSLWPSNPRKVDFLGQMATFLGQHNNLNPNTTLYSIFFGINDYLASLIDGDHLPQAAQVLLDQIEILASPPTNARNFMVLDVYGRGTTAPSGEAFKQSIFTGLSRFHEDGVQVGDASGAVKLNVSYINFANIWNGVLGSSPGFEAFGYTSTDSCTQCTADLGCTTIGMCDDPDHYFYWIPGHPSKETMRIMADYVQEVWKQCSV